MKRVFDKSTFPANQTFKSAPPVGGDENATPNDAVANALQQQSSSQGTLKAAEIVAVQQPEQPATTSPSVFNGHLKRRQPTSAAPVSSSPLPRLDVIPNAHSQPRRHMYNKPSERAIAINERIERMAQRWTESGFPCKFEELAHPTRAHPEPVITVGRIVCENEAPLSEASLLLESPRNIGGGVRVRLDCSSVGNVALFPGQIVMIEGINSDGRVFHVQRFLQPSNSLLKFAKPVEAYGDYSQFSDGNMAVLVSSGPYTLDHCLDFSPLTALLQKAAELKPQVLVLCGPFVDAEHSSFKAGLVDDYPEQLFRQQILLRLTEFSAENPQARIVLVPSLRDVIAPEFIYPQCPLKIDSHPRIVCVPNPCSFFVNEVLITVENNDIMKRLAEEFILRPGNDHLGRIAGCLLEQASLYPVMPAAYGANLDYSRLEDIEMQLTPDIILTPSDLGSFARPLDGGVSVCVNPGRACRKSALGSFALLTISPPPALSDEKADLVPSRLRVDFLSL